MLSKIHVKVCKAYLTGQMTVVAPSCKSRETWWLVQSGTATPISPTPPPPPTKPPGIAQFRFRLWPHRAKEDPLFQTPQPHLSLWGMPHYPKYKSQVPSWVSAGVKAASCWA